VFVSCDRPTVVSNAHGKLRYTSVRIDNLRDLTHMTPFHAPVFRDCLALVSGTQLMIGHIDEIEKLHIKKVHTNGHARRLAHQPSSHTLGVVVIEPNANPASLTGETCKVKLYDDQSFRKMGELTLEQDEQAQCIYSHKLSVTNTAGAAAAASSSSSASEYFIVGTAYVDPAELEPSRGRILVLQVDTSDHDRTQLHVVAHATIKGSAMSLDVLQGRIVAGVNAKVVVYRCLSSLDSAPGHFRLDKECDYVGNVFVTRVRASADGQYVLVQDLFKSMSMLLFNAQPNTNGLQTSSSASSLEEVARHYDSLWLTAFESFSAADDVLLLSDHHLNLLTLRRQLDTTVSAEERQRLETIGQWHSGEFINVIARGSLVMNLPTEPEPAVASSSIGDASVASSSSSEDRVLPTHVLGSTSGALLVAAPLSSASYKFFARLEEQLESVVRVWAS
jgi:DNA damage-binding protein 1